MDNIQLPQMLEAEKAILGSLLLENNSFYEVNELLTADMFYAEAHEILYQIIHDMHMQNIKVDIISVTHFAKQKECLDKIGGAFGISNLISNVASAAHIEHHARIIMDYYVRRLIHKTCMKLLNDAIDLHNDLEDIINSVSNFIDTITTQIYSQSKVIDLQQAVLEWSQWMQKEIDPQTALSPSIRELKSYLHNYDKGYLYVIAGRPGMGKSAFTLNECFELAKRFIPVLFFSIEMEVKDLVTRSVVRETHIDGDKIRKKALSSEDWAIIDEKLATIEKSTLYIDHSPIMDFAYIKTIAKQYIRKKGIKLIAIDYLQLVKADPKLTRERQIATLTASFKQLARELSIPILLLAQLNRQTEGRTSHKPRIGDLRESGAIEQDADCIILIHRPEYYMPDDPLLAGLGNLNIAKNRHGRTGEIKVRVNYGSSEWVDFV